MIVSTHTNKEKEDCVNEYLNGADKYYLAGKYSVSNRSIDRWIEKNTQIDEVKLRVAKRSKTIPKNNQEEILKVLNTNPIIHGFNISNWNEVMIIKYIKNIYDIKINRRMAQGLKEDCKKVNDIEDEDKTRNEIEDLVTLGYNIVILDYIKIGRINSRVVESLELRKYTEAKLDVNLVIARTNNHIYLDVIVSEMNIIEKNNRIVIKTSDKEIVNIPKLRRKEIINDKYEVLKKIWKEENKDDIVFVIKDDKDIEKLLRKKSDFKYFIVKESVYNGLRKNAYENEDWKSVVDYMNKKNNDGRLYRSIRDISNVVKGKVESYVSKVTIDKMEQQDDLKRASERESIMKKNKDEIKKYFKILKSQFIYNI